MYFNVEVFYGTWQDITNTIRMDWNRMDLQHDNVLWGVIGVKKPAWGGKELNGSQHEGFL